MSRKRCSRSVWIGLFAVLLFTSNPVFSQIFSDESVKISQVLNWIDKYYVDSVNQQQLVETAIVEMLQTLDPHSTYLTKEEVKEMSEPLQGNFEGIGVSFNILDDTIFIINPIPGGPSEKVGIMAGDRIVKIESENVGGIGIKNTDVFKKLRGEKGTRVTVSVKRRSVSELLEFTITRDKIPIYSVDANYMINQETGYIKINRFAMTTLDEFRKALADLKRQGIEDLILDLSNNGGGYLDVAIRLADEFLDNDRLIVYTEGLNHPKRTFKASSRGEFQEGRVVIIIDEGSASASEIVAGAVQDWDRGIIIGRRSFGKGLVQSPLKLIDSSMVRLTIARYYTPTGRLIQKSYSDGFEDYSQDLVQRYNNGELSDEDKIAFPDSLRFETMLSQRTVYGGGGIMPDFFVPIDTSFISEYYRKIQNRGIFNFFILAYVDDHRSDLLSAYPDFELYKKNFTVSDEIMAELVKHAEDEGLEADEEDFNTSEKYLKLLFKAYVARDLWNTSCFYEIVNTVNPSVQKALEVLDGSKMYQAVFQRQDNK